MAKALLSEVGRVAFELDRFELVEGEACQVEGRWFGVRGRRFMRPALTLVVDGQRTRLLADLAHKPWAAEDGQQWQAVFPCRLTGEAIDEAELTVGPDVTIALPAPGGQGGSGRPRPSAPAAEAAAPAAEGATPRSAAVRRRPSRDGAAARPQSGDGRSKDRRTRGESLVDLTQELGRERAARQRLERQLERSEGERTQALARIDELTDELDGLRRERDEARAAADAARAAADAAVAADEATQRERDQIRAARDAARRDRANADAGRAASLRERDEALQTVQAAEGERERALAERDAAAAAQADAFAERDAAITARDEAVAERDGARALREHAFAERDAAQASHDDAVAQRDALSRTNERLQAELTDLLSAKGAALVMRRAAQDSPASRPYALLLPRAVAGAVVLVIVLVVLLVLHVL